MNEIIFAIYGSMVIYGRLWSSFDLWGERV
jgi:hypothetical protein